MKILTLKKDHSCSHEENRLKVCLICGQKKKNLFEITNTLSELVNKYFLYDSCDKSLPKALCLFCKSKLYKYASEKSPRTHLISPVYSSYNYINTITRSRSNEQCACKICLLARKKGKSKFKVVMKNGSGKKCSKCLSTIAKGKKHKCTKSALIKNFNSSFDKTTKDQVVSNLLQEKLQSSNSERNVHLSQVKGKPLNVSIGLPVKSNEKFMISADTMTQLSVNYG